MEGVGGGCKKIGVWGGWLGGVWKGEQVMTRGGGGG